MSKLRLVHIQLTFISYCHKSDEPYIWHVQVIVNIYTCFLYGLYDIYGTCTIHADTEGFDYSQEYGKLSFGVE